MLRGRTLVCDVDGTLVPPWPGGREAAIVAYGKAAVERSSPSTSAAALRAQRGLRYPGLHAEALAQQVLCYPPPSPVLGGPAALEGAAADGWRLVVVTAGDLAVGALKLLAAGYRPGMFTFAYTSPYGANKAYVYAAHRVGCGDVCLGDTEDDMLAALEVGATPIVVHHGTREPPTWATVRGCMTMSGLDTLLATLADM